MTNDERKPFRLFMLAFYGVCSAVLGYILGFYSIVLTSVFCTFLTLSAATVASIQENWWSNPDCKLGLSLLLYFVWILPFPSAEPWLSLTSWVWLLAFVDDCKCFQYRILIITTTIINLCLTFALITTSEGYFPMLVHLSLAPFALCINTALFKERQHFLEHASVEPLSGTYSEAHLLRRLPEEIARSLYTQKALSILMLKIEDFDLFTEGNTRQQVVEFLAAFRSSLSTDIRAADDMFYLKHGDFLLLVSNCNAEGNQVLKDRLIRQLETRSWPTLGKLHFLAGLATLEPNENANEFLSRARHQLNKQQQTALKLVAFAES